MPACPPKHHAVSLPWWERSGLRWGSAMGSTIPACPLLTRGSWEAQDGLSLPWLDLWRGFSGGKRLRDGIGVALGSVGVGGGPLPSCVSPPWAATAAGRGSEWGMLCASGQDQAMGPGSGSPEMATRGNLAPRPPRPPPPRGSPALHAGPPRPPAGPSWLSKQHQVPAPRETKHSAVRGLTEGTWGGAIQQGAGDGSWGAGRQQHPRAGRMQPAAPSLVGAVCICTCGYVRARTPAPRRPGRGVCHRNLRPPPGP